MKNKAPTLYLYLLLVLQLLGLIALYGYHHVGLGAPVYLLQAHPVDPRDLLRGDYMIVRYEISSLPEGYKADLFQTTTVFVTLQQKESFWVINEVLDWEPRDGRPFLRAKLEGTNLIYDMEKVFVPEGKGNPPGKITVEAAVRPDGRAQIKQLYNDGKAWP